MKTELTHGKKVLWLYWPPDARYRSWKGVDAEVITTTNGRVAIRCWDKTGKAHVRYVIADRLIVEGQPGYESGGCGQYADGFYPLKGDAPVYKSK